MQEHVKRIQSRKRYILGIACLLLGTLGAFSAILIKLDILPIIAFPAWVMSPFLLLVGYVLVQKAYRARAKIWAILLFFAFPILFYLFGPPEISTRCNNRDLCRFHQSMLATAVIKYANNHNDRLPGSWEDLKGYLDETDIRCPSVDQSNGYGFNAYLKGRSLGDFDRPTEILLFADAVRPQSYLTTQLDIDRTRHSNYNVKGYVAVFLDGHAEFIPADRKVRLH